MAQVRHSVRLAWRGRIAADPGSLRLRTALLSVLSVMLSSAVLYEVGPAIGIQAVIAMLLGGVIVMNGAFSIPGRTNLDASLTLCGFPLAAAAGVLPAAAFLGHRTLELVGFIVVMVASVYVRRYGPRWFNYGMLTWFMYFFATFINVSLDHVPAFLLVIVISTVCVFVVMLVFTPDRPAQTQRALRASFRARVMALLTIAGDVISGDIPGEQAEGRLHAGTFRLVEGSLILDGFLARTNHQVASAARRALFDAELAAEELADGVASLPPGRLHPAVREGLVTALHALTQHALDEHRSGALHPALEQLRQSVEATGPDELDAQVLAVAAALERLELVLNRPDPVITGSAGSYEPAVELVLGNLPGSAASVLNVLANSGGRLSLNTRLCVQVAIASPIALVVGLRLSPERYYWSVLACYLVLSGTLTTGEAAAKGANRVIGTVAGLVTATLAVDITGKHDAAIVAVMMFCVFVGLYFFRVSYALMAFAVTTIMGLLYNVLDEFSDRLLLLRLVETAIGAAIAIAVVLVVLPVRTADARSSAQASFLRQLELLLADARDRLRSPGATANLFFDARRLDSALHQLALVARPSSGATLTGLNRPGALAALAGYTAVAYRARRLAAGVMQVETGSQPELADNCEMLRQRCLQATVGSSLPCSPPDPDHDVQQLFDDLQHVLDALGRRQESPHQARA